MFSLLRRPRLHAKWGLHRRFSTQPGAVAELNERKLISAVTGDNISAIDEFLSSESRSIYCGFDPTSSGGLHVGHLPLMVMLRTLSDAGHKVYCLVGSATARIGDPSGRSTERPILSEEDISRNCDAMSSDLQHFLPDAKFVDNLEWYGQMSVLDFFGQIGRHVRVGSLLNRDLFKRRLEAEDAGLTFTELSYPLLQGNDFVHLHQKYNVTIQVGGGDQWGNIVSGIELAQRLLPEKKDPLHALTVPLIASKDGVKLGKTAGNAVWLKRPKDTSAFALYQYLLQVTDDEVRDRLLQITRLSRSEVEEVMREHTESGEENRVAQRKLGAAVVEWCYGRDMVFTVEKMTEHLFPPQELGVKDGHEDWVEAAAASEMLPVAIASPGGCIGESALPFSTALVKAGFCPSQAELRRWAKAGAFIVNNSYKPTVDDLRLMSVTKAREMFGLGGSKKYSLLRHGKKKYTVLKWA